MIPIEKSKVETTVLQILSVVLMLPLSDLNADTSMENNFKWDSLKHIEVIFAIEDELNVQFTEVEFGHLISVPRIVEAVIAHHAA